MGNATDASTCLRRASLALMVWAAATGCSQAPAAPAVDAWPADNGGATADGLGEPGDTATTRPLDGGSPVDAVATGADTPGQVDDVQDHDTGGLDGAGQGKDAIAATDDTSDAGDSAMDDSAMDDSAMDDSAMDDAVETADAADSAGMPDSTEVADAVGGNDTKDAAESLDSGAADADASVDAATSPAASVPYSAQFDCAPATSDWQFDPPSSGSKATWGIDATPAQPAAAGDGCSLNFNDGSGFGCTSTIYATATSPAIDTSNVAPGTPLALRFALAGTWPGDFSANLAVKASGDGSTYAFLAGPASPGLTWKVQALDVSAYAGGKLWLQFVFYTTNCKAPLGTGPFIDALEVVALSCVPANCDDGNVCSKDLCDLVKDSCVHVDQPATPCEDGDACTVGDFCLNLKCISGAGAKCSDGDPCTTDGCDAKGCVYKALDCSDGDPCTTDTCGAAGCSHAAKVCDDQNPCTSDACANGACTASPHSGPCSDGDACTGPDLCAAGACKAGAAIDCDDSDPCTVDACNSGTGLCSHLPGGLCGKPAKTLPYTMKFGCTDPELASWTATGTPGGPGFAYDADPAWYPFKGYHSAACSANFNNGSTYECPPKTGALGVSGALTSPVLNGTAVPAGSELWVSAWMAGEFGTDDKLELQGSSDGATWITVRAWGADQLFDTAWRQFIDPLPAYAGKPFQLRWKFTSGDCYQNNKLGVFIDDVSVYVAAPCAQGEPYSGAEVVPGYTMGSSLPYQLDPPLYTGSVNQTAKASWHVKGVSKKPVTVKVQYSGAGLASVCVQHICDGSPACAIPCPAGTKPNPTKTGCCTTKVASGTISYTPASNGNGSGTTTVSVVATAPLCQAVQVKALF